MNPIIQFGTGPAMLTISFGMMFYEHIRSKAGRPLKDNEATAIPYWVAYLSLLLLGGCFTLASIINK